MKKNKKFNLVIIGASGSGKGTQAKIIAKNYGMLHVSSGDVLRQEVARQTPIGKKISQFLDKGMWVPNEVICKMIFSRLKEAFFRGFILDGSPRTVVQAELIDDFLEKQKLEINLVILIKVRPEVVLARREKVIADGKKFQTGRNDDYPEAFKSRFESYMKTIQPILEYYREKGILIEIDGERPIDDIYKDIVLELEKIS